MPFYTHDNVPDSPINNFATWNLLRAGTQNLADGNLKISAESENHWSTLAVDPTDTNKYYFEILVITQKIHQQKVGVSNQSGTATNYVGSDANGWGIIFQSNVSNGELIHNATVTSTGITFSNGDIVQICFTANKIWFGKNGTFIGNPSTESSPSFSNLSGTLSPVVTNRFDTGGSVCVNFGQDPAFGGAKAPTTTYPDANGLGQFHYQPPDGALALCTANIPEGQIKLSQDQTPSDHFKAVTWTGQTVGGAMTAWDGTTGTVNVGFQPDLVWIKRRNADGSHCLFDSIRGATHGLHSDTTQQQWTDTTTLTALNSNGFSLSTHQYVNISAGTYSAWCWKAAGSPSATDDGTGVTGSAKIINEDGSANTSIQDCAALATAATNAGASNVITPSKVSANRQNGFSIVKYVGDQGTGSTVPHGLLQVPQIVLVKPLNGTTTYGWRMYTEMTGNTKYLQLNAPDQAVTYTDWNSTSPTTNVFTVNSSAAQTNNENGTSYIAYCWHSVAGYSKFGSYVGNGSADGPFVYCGFRPAWLLIKNIDLAGDWWLMDATRDPYNVAEKVLYPNLPAAEYVGASVFGRDFLSNGFKVRNNNFGVNGNYTYIYMAFAEQPFSGPSNAR